MKKLLSVAVFFLVSIALALALASTSMVYASPSPSFDVKVQHVVDIRQSGLLVINETVTLSPASGDSIEPLRDYTVGMPFDYQSDLAYAFGYEAANPGSRLTLDLNAGMGRIGFYGIKVNFPQPIDISDGGSYEFTVVLVFSNSIAFDVYQLEETVLVYYNASFPAFPSLPDMVSEAQVRIIMPETLNYTRSSFEDEGVNLTGSTQGTNSVFSFVKKDLDEFSREPAWFYALRLGGVTQLLNIEEAERKIDILADDRIAVSDFYKALNKAGDLTTVQLKLPTGAYEITAFDEFGQVAENNIATQPTATHTNTTVTFASPYLEGKEIHLSIQYSLPWSNNVATSGFGQFHTSLLLFDTHDLTIGKLTVALSLPEGATLSSPIDSKGLAEFQSSAFSSRVVFAFQNATPFQDYTVDFTYRRPLFWDSFRPTVWMGAFVLVVGALVGAWRIYQPPSAPALPTAVVGIRAEDLRTFVNYYDERRRLLKEVESLEAATRKGKIPRRQYKVRKATLDGRLASLSRDLTASKDKLRTAGPRYAELMRQLEVAETELMGAEAEINRSEVRYRRGDLSAQAYHNVLEANYRRRDKAQTTIDGVLLRLREEIG